jgi:thiol-disulfide isomerase/thioredoxin
LSSRLLRYALYSFIALLALGAGMWVSNTRQKEAPVSSAADVIFALALPDLENKPQQLSQWRGQVLVVNFWATWCAPCRDEIPMLVKMQEKYLPKGLKIVGISIDQADKTSEFARSFGINYPTLIGNFDTVDVSRRAGNTKGVLPYTVILDRKGQIAATELGGLTLEKLEAVIAPLL